LGNREWGSFCGDFERQMKEGFGNGASLCGSSVRGNWREGSFTADAEGYVKADSGNRHLSQYRPRSGSCWRIIYWRHYRKNEGRLERYVKEGSRKGSVSP
jgi:hypothetical protein